MKIIKVLNIILKVIDFFFINDKEKDKINLVYNDKFNNEKAKLSN